MDNHEIASELKVAILYREENDGAVKRIAEIIGLKPRTIYDYLDGNIKISLDFLHAAVVATDGDPDVRKFLEPKGWGLEFKSVKAPTKNTNKELVDITIAVGDFYTAVRDAVKDGFVTRPEAITIERKAQNAKKQIEEVLQLVKEIKSLQAV